MKWHIVELIDQLDDDWGEFLISAEDEHGEYNALTQCHISDPSINEVYNIEKL